MASKSVSKRRLSAWYIPAALIIFFIVLWLVLQQVSSTNLSADIYRGQPYIYKWQCQISCQCTMQGMQGLEPDPYVTGTYEVCSMSDISNGQIQYPGTAFITPAPNGRFTCPQACGERGGWFLGNWTSNGSCKKIGTCPTTTKKPIIPTSPKSSTTTSPAV